MADSFEQPASGALDFKALTLQASLQRAELEAEQRALNVQLEDNQITKAAYNQRQAEIQSILYGRSSPAEAADARYRTVSTEVERSNRLNITPSDQLKQDAARFGLSVGGEQTASAPTSGNFRPSTVPGADPTGFTPIQSSPANSSESASLANRSRPDSFSPGTGVSSATPARSGGSPTVELPKTPTAIATKSNPIIPSGLRMQTPPPSTVAGSVKAGAFGAALTLATGLLQGQSPGAASAMAGGEFVGAIAGGIAGGAIGSLLGPLGTEFGAFIGTGIGGYLGASVGGSLYHLLFPNAPTRNPAEQPGENGIPPFYGGQERGAVYRIDYQDYRKYPDSQGVYSYRLFSTSSTLCYGPIESMNWIQVGDAHYYQVMAHGRPPDAFSDQAQPFSLAETGPWVTFDPWTQKNVDVSPRLEKSISKYDASPDTGGNPSPEPGSPTYIIQPIINSQSPAASNSPKPSVLTGTASKAANSPLNSARLAPSLAPEPLPVVKLPQKNVLAPNSAPKSAVKPASSTAGQGRPGGKPSNAGSSVGRVLTSPDKLPSGTVPDLAHLIGAGIPILPLIRPAAAPKKSGTTAKTAPSSTTNRQPGGKAGEAKEGTNDSPAPSTADQTGSSGGINAPSPTSPNNVCRYLPILDQKILKNSQELEVLTTFITQTQLVNIDTKLGDQLPGGIGGFVSKSWGVVKKTYNFLQVDRVLNVLSWIGILHNAIMLSSAVKDTLFGAINNILQVFGIEGVDDNGKAEAIDVSKVVNSFLESLFKTVFGEENLKGIKKEWKSVNRIYQSAANIYFSLQSISYSILNAIETTGHWIAWIGNALKKYGVVIEKAYSWMNPTVNFTNNKVFDALNKAQDAVSAIDQVSAEVLNIEQTGKQIGDDFKNLKKEISGKDDESKKDVDVKDRTTPEDTKTASAESKSKDDSKSSPIADSDLNKPES